MQDGAQLGASWLGEKDHQNGLGSPLRASASDRPQLWADLNIRPAFTACYFLALAYLEPQVC